ncbi:MAG: heavy-metal-associated domain-containing protein [Desulfobacteraceae bacterium]|nr:heavy-metal-associated domain-containing protein [Desulfobacteraceae bacterium]
MKKTLSVEGMTCMHCSGRVKKYLESNSGISNITVDLGNKEAAFTCDNTVNLDTVIKDITELGYTAKER